MANSADGKCFSTKMANSADGKCFSTVLRRLLCSGSPPTHPSDHFLEPNIEEFDPQKHENHLKLPEVESKPGLIARLMGLESFPSTPLLPKDTTLGSFFRSKSVNSIDFLSHFDPIKHQHRRVRTSVSFREGLGDDYSNAILLQLEELDEIAGCEQELLIKSRPNVHYHKGGKSENLEEKKRSLLNGKTRERLKEKRQIVKAKEELRGSKCLKKKKNNILGPKVHPGCNMKKVHPEGIVPEVATKRVHSRKKLPSQMGRYSSDAHSHNGEAIAIIKGKNKRKMKSNKESCYYKEMVEEICRLTEEDIKENWINLKFGDFEELCQQFGQEILEVLLRQLVDELLLIYMR